MPSSVQTVGVIGGGQLAWMMGQVAATVGVKLVVQTPSATDPAVAVAQSVIPAAVSDVAGTERLAQQCDVITFENEFVDLPGLEHLVNRGTRFYPSLSTLQPLLDKWAQRHFLARLGLPVPSFQAYSPGSARELSFPCVLKTRRHGYDGQGTRIIRQAIDLPQTEVDPESWLLEAFVPYERELAIIGARNTTGEIRLYPVVETYQVDQVCRWVVAPAFLDAAIVATVNHYCRQVLEALDYVGVLGMELFLLPERPGQPHQQLLINELAPRTHNSGHYTLEACATSQFAMQLQAVTGQPLGNTDLTCVQAVMVNLLGYESTESESDYSQALTALSNYPNAHLRWYGKPQARPGRKLGHVTVTLPQALPLVALKQIINDIEALWYPLPFRCQFQG